MPFFQGRQFVRGVIWTVNHRAHLLYYQRAEAARQYAAEQKRRLVEATSKVDQL